MAFRKDHTLYWAKFANLKLRAWGFDQVLRETFLVTVYQVTCNPACWAARPQFAPHRHKWEASSAEAVMRQVEADFETKLDDWQNRNPPDKVQPSLRSAADVDSGRKRA